MGHLQKSIVDNVTNIYGILFIATISLLSGAFGLYHAWRLSTNSEKSAEKLNLAILPPSAFFILAALSSGALLPYFSHHALRCDMFYPFFLFFLAESETVYVFFFEQGFCCEAVDLSVEELGRKIDVEKKKHRPSHQQRLYCYSSY